jgi:hypothetical protein
MANTSQSRGSKRARVKGEHPTAQQGGQLDIIGAYNTGYPVLRAQKGFRGNGATPGNPFGGQIATPTEENK